MTDQSTKIENSQATLGDVLAWAEANGEKRDTLYELKKVPARLNMATEDIGLLPADLQHFEHVVAPAPYGMVSSSKDLEQARRRGNSRVRGLLERFWVVQGDQTPVPENVAQSYTDLINWVRAQEGFVERGARFTTSTHKCLFALRARCQVPLPELDQGEIDRVFAEATTEKRKSLQRGVKLLNRLQRGMNAWPEIRPRLPKTNFEIPKSSDRAERILWTSLPEALRCDAETVFREVLMTQDDLSAWAKAQMAAGVASLEIDQAVAQKVKIRGRRPRNSKTALAGYRGAVTWLARSVRQHDGGLPQIAGLRDLMTRDRISNAIEDQIARSQASLLLKDPKKTQTLGNRLKNLRTIARNGLYDPEIVAHVDVLRVVFEDYVVTPREMHDNAEEICKLLQRRPGLAAKLVNAPAALALKAEVWLKDARDHQDEQRELVALRLFAAAVLHAIQMSRPLRPANLIALRCRGSQEIAGNLSWVRKGGHAELRFAPGEIKNDREVTVHVMGADAQILADWMDKHRHRLLELMGLSDSPYVFPGEASPRNVKDAITLPHGCMSASSFAELWALGAQEVGLGLTPHLCRHALATLILAIEPGNFAKAAAVLGDTEETVRRHYGRDSGEEAAKSVRAALLARHPALFKSMKRKLK
ncbi:hypothetical protein FIU97_19380 (plasmid) [Roseivivax sp. THAF40]|uniref:site-specific integrase n=1 Tax=unclassified Roseivivax TaxID=2639302 RepID=UPI0012681305|nr:MULTISPECIES: site-specific integrase [unclassified Roseivivax]QFS84856.1 hypothetical protein FIV09_18595 [Roseivivax sp. THAF197b]QFT48758.1 hypothetical protein FIU97_19380 [Roseivivax sp. THAF40]